MSIEQFREELDQLFNEWESNGAVDSRYAAMLHLLKVWIFDPKFKDDPFPSDLVLRLISMSRNPDRTIRAMAFSSLVLIVMRFDGILSQTVTSAIEGLYKDENLRKDMVELQKYFFTTVISFKVRKEFTEKHNIDDMREKLNKLVEEGVDMNQGTFLLTSQHDFFKTLRNWLIDFDVNNPVFKPENRKRLILFYTMTNVCDLDKYALAISMDKNNGISVLTDDIPDNYTEIIKGSDTQTALKTVREHFAYMYTFQTLFRLFCLSPWRKILYDPFSMGPFMSDFSKLTTFCSTKAFLEEMAQLFMRHEFYAHAASYARTLLNHNDCVLEMLQVLAKCDKNLGEDKEQLECLLRLEELKPDDLDIAADTGLALLEAKRYDEALQRFFHLEVMDKGTRRNTRSIAWCSLMTHNTRRSQRYYQKLLDWQGGPSWMDLLNAGHSAWLSGDPDTARDLYRRYLQQHSDNLKAFDNDKPQLLSLGLTDSAINHMRAAIQG